MRHPQILRYEISRTEERLRNRQKLGQRIRLGKRLDRLRNELQVCLVIEALTK